MKILWISQLILPQSVVFVEKIAKNKWYVTHSEEDGEKTIVEKQNIKLNEQKEQIKANPHFAEVFKHFPQAEITSIEDKKSN